MNKKAQTRELKKILLTLLALAALAWILYKYVIKPIMEAKFGF